MPRRTEFPRDPSLLDALPSEDSSPGSLDAVIDAVEALPERQREVIELRFWARMSQQQVANQLGLTQQTVDYHEKRALEALREVLNGEAGD
jgi:RNA polymerase sigma factor (sigma-70 family)